MRRYLIVNTLWYGFVTVMSLWIVAWVFVKVPYNLVFDEDAI